MGSMAPGSSLKPLEPEELRNLDAWLQWDKTKTIEERDDED